MDDRRRLFALDDFVRHGHGGGLDVDLGAHVGRGDVDRRGVDVDDRRRGGRLGGGGVAVDLGAAHLAGGERLGGDDFRRFLGVGDDDRGRRGEAGLFHHQLFLRQLVEDVLEFVALLGGEAGAAGQAGFQQAAVGFGFLERVDPLPAFALEAAGVAEFVVAFGGNGLAADLEGNGAGKQRHGEPFFVERLHERGDQPVLQHHPRFALGKLGDAGAAVVDFVHVAGEVVGGDIEAGGEAAQARLEEGLEIGVRIFRVPRIQLVAGRQLEHFAGFDLDLRQAATEAIGHAADGVRRIVGAFERGDLAGADLGGNDGGFLEVVDDAAAHDDGVQPGDAAHLLGAFGREQVVDVGGRHALGGVAGQRVVVAGVVALDVVGDRAQGAVDLDALADGVAVVEAHVHGFVEAVGFEQLQRDAVGQPAVADDADQRLAVARHALDGGAQQRIKGFMAAGQVAGLAPAFPMDFDGVVGGLVELGGGVRVAQILERADLQARVGAADDVGGDQRQEAFAVFVVLRQVAGAGAQDRQGHVEVGIDRAGPVGEARCQAIDGAAGESAARAVAVGGGERVTAAGERAPGGAHAFG